MEIYPAYLKVCTDAIKSDLVFKNFRNRPAYHSVVEGIPGWMGIEYVNYIEEHYPHLLLHLDKFLIGDQIGRPKMYYYPSLKVYMSSVTCRYIKILGDLTMLFGPLNNLDIVEIGAGYGGQCKIIHDYIKPKSYTIIDLPPALELTKKYLKQFGITDVKFKSPKNNLFDRYSLCISNYAFSEFDRKYQDFYVDKVINNSERGYMICNFFGKNALQERSDCFTKEEIQKIKSSGEILPEEPCSTEGNFLYIW